MQTRTVKAKTLKDGDVVVCLWAIYDVGHSGYITDAKHGTGELELWNDDDDVEIRDEVDDV